MPAGVVGAKGMSGLVRPGHGVGRSKNRMSRTSSQLVAGPQEYANKSTVVVVSLVGSMVCDRLGTADARDLSESLVSI